MRYFNWVRREFSTKATYALILCMGYTALWLTGCLESNAIDCGDHLCPTGSVCIANSCASPREASACANLSNGAMCSYEGLSNGVCADGACRAIICGDGVRVGNEACDDGNITPGDGCSSDCQSQETCGNGIVDRARGEQCDDGNVENGDACHADCQVPRCGDGVRDIQSGEACDDGAANGNAPNVNCRSNCQLRRCGDGVRDAGETCDDGNIVSGDGCSGDCASDERCGNGYVDIVRNEACDDGNQIDADDCSNACRLPNCGDGVINIAAGEFCDDGANNGNAPNTPCRTNCQPKRCGDGILDATENCDDGNLVSGDGCSGDCQSTESCGNGYVDIAKGEQCDDANTDNGDTCHANCTIPRCGDGIVDLQAGEGCDRGNENANTPNAPCRRNCQPQRCGDTIIDNGEHCDDGNLLSGDGCSGDCQSNESCGNAYIDSVKGEQCDDAYPRGLSNDGCSSRCGIELQGWKQQIPQDLRRQDHAMAYDAKRQRIVVFGGHGSNGPSGDFVEICWS